MKQVVFAAKKVRPVAAVVFAFLVFAPGGVRSDSGEQCSEEDIKKVAALNIKATGQYDEYDFEGAKQTLNDAIALAEKLGCGKHLVAARSYLYLGVVESGGFREFDEAKKAWFKAFSLFPGIEVPRRLATPRLMRDYDRIQAMFKARGQVVADPRTTDDTTVKTTPKIEEPQTPPQGLEHFPVPEAEETVDLEIRTRVEDAMNPGRVTLYYRPEFAADYRSIELAKKGEWTWVGEIPGKDVRGELMRYYLVVRNTEGNPIAASGTAASPHLVTLKRPGAKIKSGVFVENPLTGERRFVSEDEVPDEVEIPGQKRRAEMQLRKTEKPHVGFQPLFSVFLGTGIGVGLLNGETEVARSPEDFDKGKELPNSLSSGSLYGHLDIGYFIHPRFTIGALGRIGKTFISKAVAEEGKGNHYDWLILGRAKYFSRPYSMPGVSWMGWKWFAGGGLGYGYIRHHVRANDVDISEPGEQVSVTDTGRSKGVVPNLLAGAKLLFLGGRLNVFFEANYLASLSGNTDNNLYFHLDFTLGVSTEF